MRFWLLLFIVFFPTFAFAAGAFTVDPSDKSMTYLATIFGSIPGLPIQGTTNPLFSQIVYIFNQIVFGLGIVIVIYTTFIGTLNTAQEGEFLGKTSNWHPILVPLRAAIGIYLLLPTAASYNWIQIGVMWFIVQGVGAANALWTETITQNQNQGTIHQESSAASLQQSYSSVISIFNAVVCMEAINNNPTAVGIMNESLRVYAYQGQVQFGRQSQAGQEQPLCGSVTLPLVGKSIIDTSDNSVVTSNLSIFSSAVQLAAMILQPAADAALNGGPGDANLFANAATALENAARSTTHAQTLTQINQQAIDNGWIHAGSYYFELTQSDAITSTPVTLQASNMNYNAISNVLGTTLANQIAVRVNTASAFYILGVSASLPQINSQGSQQLQLNPLPGAGNAPSVLASIFGGLFGSIIQSIQNAITTSGANQDPILSMASFGANITSTTEIFFWSALGIAFGMWLASSVMSCIQPMAFAMNFVLTVTMAIASILIALFWVEGVTMALYVPLIPYLVFSFSAITWFILVVESMLGSSLIALTLVVPSEDEIGKAGHAIVILLGLFLRPALMIVGFVIAIKLLDVGIGFLNYGFWPTIVASTGAASGVGVFGLVAILFIYTGVAVGLVHEAFRLIYELPNKVLRWMGGSGEEDEAGKHTQELKGSVQKGAGIAKSGMSTGMTKMGNAAKSK